MVCLEGQCQRADWEEPEEPAQGPGARCCPLGGMSQTMWDLCMWLCAWNSKFPSAEHVSWSWLFSILWVAFLYLGKPLIMNWYFPNIEVDSNSESFCSEDAVWIQTLPIRYICVNLQFFHEEHEKTYWDGACIFGGSVLWQHFLQCSV